MHDAKVVVPRPDPTKLILGGIVVGSIQNSFKQMTAVSGGVSTGVISPDIHEKLGCYSKLGSE